MSIKARYTGGSLTGVDLAIQFKDGDVVQVHVPHGGELPAEVGGRKVPADYRDGLLEQTDNWSEVKRDSSPTSKDGEK
jgi:hypothetical protein